jgi:adenosylcobinamide kinase/adenosylcobinamide-phosphate guanylyltransferase
MLTLIGGGARSGKSTAALLRAKKHIEDGGRVLFIATAEASDDEMADRIVRHQNERGEGFDLVEEPRNLELALAAFPKNELVIVDCLTLWLSNTMMDENEINVPAVISAARMRKGSTIFVSNETGEGIVPMHPVSRKFRDLSGSMNQEFARLCDEVFYMKFGIETKIK